MGLDTIGGYVLFFGSFFNMGRLRTEMSVSDMSMKYTLLNDADQAKIIWNAAYENSHHRDRGGRLTELLIFDVVIIFMNFNSFHI